MTNGPGAGLGQTTQTGTADKGAQQSNEGHVMGPPGILVAGRGGNQS